MGIKLLMPSLSPTMEEGNISKWHVKVGDKISEGSVLCSVETDKTTVDYESLDEGYLRAIIIDAGNNARVNQLIAYITDEADDDYEDDLKVAIEDDKKAQEEAKPAAAAPATPAVAAPAPIAAPVPNFSVPKAPSPLAVPESKPIGSVKASPIARKMAAERAIDLTKVKGSGPNGRVVIADIENYVPPKAAIAGPIKADPSKEPITIGSLAAIPDTVDEPLSQVMKVIGQRLAKSQTEAVEFFVAIKIQVDALNSLRKQLNATPGYKISINDLVVKGVAMNLRQFPVVNSSFYGDFIRKNSNIDISIAVSTPDGGLITPIVKDADRKAVGHISAEVKTLVKKAAAGTLSPEEFQGGTFTVSNMGMFGVSSFTSIINPPQSAILAVAGVEEVLYRKEDGEIGSRNMMTVNLTADHRVINGALAAEFVNGLKKILENPACMML